MTTERLDTVSLGSCPVCHGPVQFLSADEGTQSCREVRLPNIDEDLGGGWHLTDIYRMLQVSAPERTWRAGAQDRFRLVLYGWGDSPSTAYLALRTVIENRP